MSHANNFLTYALHRQLQRGTFYSSAFLKPIAIWNSINAHVLVVDDSSQYRLHQCFRMHRFLPWLRSGTGLDILCILMHCLNILGTTASNDLKHFRSFPTHSTPANAVNNDAKPLTKFVTHLLCANTPLPVWNKDNYPTHIVPTQIAVTAPQLGISQYSLAAFCMLGSRLDSTWLH